MKNLKTKKYIVFVHDDSANKKDALQSSKKHSTISEAINSAIKEFEIDRDEFRQNLKTPTIKGNKIHLYLFH